MKKFLALAVMGVLSIFVAAGGLVAQNRDEDPVPRRARAPVAEQSRSRTARPASDKAAAAPADSTRAAGTRKTRAAANEASPSSNAASSAKKPSRASVSRRAGDAGAAAANGARRRAGSQSDGPDGGDLSPARAASGGRAASNRRMNAPASRFNMDKADGGSRDSRRAGSTGRARSAGWGSEADAEMNGVVRDVWTRRDGAAMRDMLRNNRSARGEAGDSVRSNPFQRRLNDDGTVASRRGGRLDDVQTDCSRGEVLINTGAEQVCGRCDSHAQYNPASMQCVCRAGWTGDGMSCTATVDPGSCGQYAQYDVEKGACACRPGYGGDGITCRACHESASVDASGACACRPGYFGDGFSCESNCRPGFIANNSAFTCEPACPAGYRVQLGSN